MYHNLRTTLYHGTVSEIKQIDVKLGRGKKDFGRGFYMAASKKQAVGMMHKKYKEAVRRNKLKQESKFSEKLYEITLKEKGGMPHNYDMVIGPTADDDTALCLKTYWDGLYGKVGSNTAKETLLNNLETENLGIQYFIGKQEVADKLIADIKLIDWR